MLFVYPFFAKKPKDINEFIAVLIIPYCFLFSVLICFLDFFIIDLFIAYVGKDWAGIKSYLSLFVLR